MRTNSIWITAVACALFFFLVPAYGTTYYLDGSVASSGNGLSWSSAWKSFSNVTGLQPGDTVMVAGGSYSLSSPVAGTISGTNGTQASPITYQAATDSGHNSVVTINCSGQCVAANGSVGNWITWNGNVGGAQHLVFNSSGSDAVFGQSSSGSVLRYIQINGGDLNYWGAAYVEVDHVTWTPTVGTVNIIGSGDGDAVLCPNGGPAGYTTNKIHDSTFYLWYSGPGIGLDGLKWCGNISVYNNRFIGVKNSNYTGGQHQDGTQSFQDYEAYYNNYYENLQNYAIYMDPHDSGSNSVNHWRVYNNVINQWSGGPYGVASGCENVSCTITDMIVANNTVVNSAGCMGFSNSTWPANYSSSYVVNNICYNSSAMNIAQYSGTLTVSNNTNGSTSGLTFVNAQTNASGDWHLTSGATAAIDKGISPSYLTTLFNVDKDGVARPQGAAWDIGAYEYKSGSTGPAAPTGLTATAQ